MIFENQAFLGVKGLITVINKIDFLNKILS